MSRGMDWEKRSRKENARVIRGPRGDYDPTGAVRDDQRRNLRYWARRTETDLPTLRGMTQDQADELIGYMRDLAKGIVR